MRALNGPSVRGHLRSSRAPRFLTGVVAVLSLLSCKEGGAPGSDISGAVLAGDPVVTALALPTTPGITLVAGGLGGSGTIDGTGTGARFYMPSGVAAAADGTLYVADSGNHTIRKISPTGEVTTFAGVAGQSGSTDSGAPEGPRFKSPSGVAVAPDGTVYVADSGNFTVRKITPAGVVSTFAGRAGESGRDDALSDDGTGADARFNTPFGIAVAADGAIYVADSISSTIRKLVPTPDGTAGVVTTFAGSKGELGATDGNLATARFRLPIGLAFDSTGNLYVADGASHNIRKITPVGDVSTLAGGSGTSGSVDGTGSAARFNQPGLIAIANDVLYVTDLVNKTVRQVTPAGVVTTLAGLAGEQGSVDGTGDQARFGVPNGIVVGADGNLIVADSLNHALRHVTLPGAVVTTPYGKVQQKGTTNATGAAARFNLPSSLVMDSLGNLLVADSLNHVIRMIEPDGAVTTYAGLAGTVGATNGGRLVARFNSPKGLAMDLNGNIYVADTGNHVIRKITPAGVVSTVAGLAGSPGTADGTGSTARFSSPWGIAADISGSLYVADAGNHTIRKVSPTGVVTTLAGVGGGYGSSNGTGSAARFSSPLGVALDSAGNIYVADTGNYMVRMVTPEGVVTTVAGRALERGAVNGGALTDARFMSPVGVLVDANDNVYVSDAGSGTVRKIAAGMVTTEVGTFGKLGVVEGPITISDKGSLNVPQGMLVGPEGQLYLTDENAVLLVVLDPPIPTFGVSLSAPDQVFLGDSFPLSWNATDAYDCMAGGNDADWAGPKTASDSKTVSLTADSLAPDMTYTLECKEIGGAGIKTATVSVSVTQPPPTVTLNVSASRVDPSGSVILTWEATNATSCTTGDDWTVAPEARPTSNTAPGETLPSLTSTKTFTLECTGEGGTASASQTVVVALAPTVSLWVSSSNITLGESVTLSWNSKNTVACSAGDNWSGTKATKGTAVITPGNSVAQLYSLTCTGAGGVVSDSTVVTVDFNTATAGNAAGSGGGAWGLDLLLGGGLLVLLRRRLAGRAA
jgi:sugar lactone lactonase YvrE